MDFRLEHKDSAGTILNDLIGSKNSLYLLLKLGKGIETNFSKLKWFSEESLIIDDHHLPIRKAKQLIGSARDAREFSYAPYSHFNVGAAILAENKAGLIKTFLGCNVENAAYGSTICAERTAAFKAVSEGFRKFIAYAVVGGFDDSIPKKIRQAAQKEYITPCGSCRQVTNEFEANPCFVIMAKDTGKVFVTTIEYILPGGFGPKSLGVNASAYDRYNKI